MMKPFQSLFRYLYKILAVSLVLVVGGNALFHFSDSLSSSLPHSHALTWTQLKEGSDLSDLNQFWENSLSDAKKTAIEKSLWILVYFEAPFAHRPPTARREVKFVRAVKSIAIGATITSENVLEASENYKVKKLPALVLLDPFGTPKKTWERRLDAQEIFNVLQAEVLLLNNQIKKFNLALDRAKVAVQAGDIKKLTVYMNEIVSIHLPRLDRWDEYIKLRTKLNLELDRLLLKVLATEGIHTDYKLGKNLKQLEKEYPYPQLVKKIKYELSRLGERKIGERF